MIVFTLLSISGNSIYSNLFSWGPRLSTNAFLLGDLAKSGIPFTLYFSKFGSLSTYFIVTTLDSSFYDFYVKVYKNLWILYFLG